MTYATSYSSSSLVREANIRLTKLWIDMEGKAEGLQSLHENVGSGIDAGISERCERVMKQLPILNKQLDILSHHMNAAFEQGVKEWSVLQEQMLSAKRFLRRIEGSARQLHDRIERDQSIMDLDKKVSQLVERVKMTKEMETRHHKERKECLELLAEDRLRCEHLLRTYGKFSHLPEFSEATRSYQATVKQIEIELPDTPKASWVHLEVKGLQDLLMEADGLQSNSLIEKSPQLAAQWRDCQLEIGASIESLPEVLKEDIYTHITRLNLEGDRPPESLEDPVIIEKALEEALKTSPQYRPFLRGEASPAHGNEPESPIGKVLERLSRKISTIEVEAEDEDLERTVYIEIGEAEHAILNYPGGLEAIIALWKYVAQFLDGDHDDIPSWGRVHACDDLGILQRAIAHVQFERNPSFFDEA